MRLFRHQFLTARLLFAGCCLLLGACAVMAPKPDPQLGEQQRLRAEQLIKGRQYQAAAEALDQAVINLPQDHQLALRYGEVLEAIDRTADAVEVYRQALERGPDKQEELRYRTALLFALQLDNLTAARTLQQALPQNSLAANDLQAVILTRSGQPRQALIRLATLIKTVHSEDQTAHIAYHAALAYQALGDAENEFLSLYQAINRAEHLGLIHQIELYWQQLEPDTEVPNGRNK